MSLPVGTRVRYDGYGNLKGCTGVVIPRTRWVLEEYSLVMIDHTSSRLRLADKLLTRIDESVGASPLTFRLSGNHTGR